jgi:phosphatidylglycerophosphate synthase
VITDSRAATNELLEGLREGRWRPQAWTRFLLHATRRSIHQARYRPRALGEITALHIVFAAVGHRKRPLWTATSWALAAAHLGMLEDRRSLGLANVITVTRANLPTLTSAWGAPVVALVSDLADGRLARRLGTPTPFGAAADSLADAAFWAWFALHHEPSRRVRAVALVAWVVPVVAVATTSVGRGRMVDAPRPVIVRPAAAMQAALAVRAVLRRTDRYRTPSATSAATDWSRSRRERTRGVCGY